MAVPKSGRYERRADYRPLRDGVRFAPKPSGAATALTSPAPKRVIDVDVTPPPARPARQERRPDYQPLRAGARPSVDVSRYVKPGADLSEAAKQEVAASLQKVRAERAAAKTERAPAEAAKREVERARAQANVDASARAARTEKAGGVDPKPKAPSREEAAPAQQAAAKKEKAAPTLMTGKRGGQFYMTASGQRVYVK